MDRGGSRAAATSKMEHFVIIVNGWKPLTIITNRFISDVAAALDPPRLWMLFLLTTLMDQFYSLYQIGFFKLSKYLLCLHCR